MYRYVREYLPHPSIVSVMPVGLGWTLDGVSENFDKQLDAHSKIENMFISVLILHHNRTPLFLDSLLV